MLNLHLRTHLLPFRSLSQKTAFIPRFSIAGFLYPYFLILLIFSNKNSLICIPHEVYDDWRLPTEAELKIIDKYQNTDGSVIDEVLGGKYYWAASGKAYRTQHGSQGSEDKAYIRCIRTVKASEPIVEDKE